MNVHDIVLESIRNRSESDGERVGTVEKTSLTTSTVRYKKGKNPLPKNSKRVQLNLLRSSLHLLSYRFVRSFGPGVNSVILQSPPMPRD